MIQRRQNRYLKKEELEAQKARFSSSSSRFAVDDDIERSVR